MSKKGVENLIQIIAQHPDGVSVIELLNMLADGMPKRTLQYNLSNLVKAGILNKKGAGRNSKYYRREISEEIPSRSFIIPLSLEAQDVQKLISAPIQLRQHVSYQRKFLESYEPNKTFYLSQPILERLFKLGDGAERGRPAGTYARKIYHGSFALSAIRVF
jgi:hypothetical protein